MSRSLVVAFSLALLIASAKADSIVLFFGFGSSGGAPLASCASTGIFNLGNVCNDIYFIGALK